MKGNRHWLQFSLRTFLVLLSALAAGLGWLSMQVHRAHEQREAVAAIERWGGSYTYEFSNLGIFIRGGPAPPWWRRLLRSALGEDYSDNVVIVALPPRESAAEYLLPRELQAPRRPPSVPAKAVDDDALAFIGRLRKLKLLTLTRTDISDAGLARLATLNELEWLSLADTGITDAGLANLATLAALQRLDLTATSISDAGVVHLKQLKRLRTLSLLQTRATETAVAELQAALPECEIITWPPTRRPSDASP